MAKHEGVADEFLAMNFSEGRVIEHSVFWKLFELQQPKGYGQAKDFERQYQLFMSRMDGLRRELLKRGHDLQNVRTKGYQLVPFHDRPKEAVCDGNRVVAKAIVGTIRRLTSIPNPEQLIGDARYVRDAGLIKYGHLRAIMRSRETIVS